MGAFVITNNLEVAPREDKMSKNHFRWFGYVQWSPISASIRRSDKIIVNGVRKLEVVLNGHGFKQLKKRWCG